MVGLDRAPPHRRTAGSRGAALRGGRESVPLRLPTGHASVFAIGQSRDTISLHDFLADELGALPGIGRIETALDQIAVDGAITKAPGGGEATGRSPVDRGKQGLKRSGMTDAFRWAVSWPGANRHDSPLLAPTLGRLESLRPLPDTITMHLNAGPRSGHFGRSAERKGARSANNVSGRSRGMMWPQS